MVFAAGISVMLATVLLYVPGIFVYAKGQKEKGLKVFETKVDKAVFCRPSGTSGYLYLLCGHRQDQSARLIRLNVVLSRAQRAERNKSGKQANRGAEAAAAF